MVRKRLITVLTFNDGVLFRTKDFIPDYRYTLNFVDAWSADEIVLLDVTRPGQGSREHFYSVVENFARRSFVPLAVGGGVRTIEDFKTLLSIGADKVVLNSMAVENPALITQGAELFGSQCVVVSIDARKRAETNTYEVFTHCGSKATGKTPKEWAIEAQAKGAGEIMVCAMDRDGSLEGYDNALNREIAEAVTIPVLVVGGAGNWQHFVDGFEEDKASGVCTTCIYHFTETSIKSAKTYLHRAGVSVRM